MAEGRRAFVEGVSGIESGEECERIAPFISAFADGEASEVDAAAVRRHMRGCAGCRAVLRESREVPARVAALAPAGLLLTPHAAAPAGHGIHALGSWLHARATEVTLRGQELFEAATAHKAAAVAASAAAIAGGGIATMQATAPARNPHRHARVVVRHPLRQIPASRPKQSAPRRHHASNARRASLAAQPSSPAQPLAAPHRAEPALPPPAPPAPKPRAKSPRPAPPQAGEFGP